MPGAVAWTATVVPGAVSEVLPDGCMDLLWMDDRLVVAGPDGRAHRSEVVDRATVWGLRFASGTMPALLGVPAHVLRDHRVPLDDLWPTDVVAELTERVAVAPDPLAALEAVAAARLRRTDRVSPVVLAAAGALVAGRPVAEVADLVGLSTRQLHRRSLDAFGYGPKVLARVARLQRALAEARRGTPLVEVALAAGYADQPHLAREVRALTDRTLTQLVA